MILPTKHIAIEASLLAIGARALAQLSQPLTVTALWERLRDEDGVVTFDRFCLALTFLHALNLVEDAHDQTLRMVSR